MSRKIEVRDFMDQNNYITTDVDSYDNYFMYTMNRRPKTPIDINSRDNVIPVKERPEIENWSTTQNKSFLQFTKGEFRHQIGTTVKCIGTMASAQQRIFKSVPHKPGNTYGYQVGIKVYVPGVVFGSGSKYIYLAGAVYRSGLDVQKFGVRFDVTTKTAIVNGTQTLAAGYTDLGGGWIYLYAIGSGDTTDTCTNVRLDMYSDANASTKPAAGTQIVIADPEIIKNPFMSDFDNYIYNVNVIMLKEFLYEDPTNQFPINIVSSKGNMIAISNDLTTRVGIEGYIQKFENLSRYIMQVPSNTSNITLLEDSIKAQSRIYSRKF